LLSGVDTGVWPDMSVVSGVSAMIDACMAEYSCWVMESAFRRPLSFSSLF